MVRGGSGTTFFPKLAVTVDRLGFFCLFWSGFRQTAPHPYPHYSNIWAYEGQAIRVDLLHLMCRKHVQHGSPQDANMLKTKTNNYFGHPGDLVQLAASSSPECKKSKMAEFLKQAVKLGHETTIFGFSTSKRIHLSPFTFLQLHNMSEHPGEQLRICSHGCVHMCMFGIYWLCAQTCGCSKRQGYKDAVPNGSAPGFSAAACNPVPIVCVKKAASTLSPYFLFIIFFSFSTDAVGLFPQALSAKFVHWSTLFGRFARDRQCNHRCIFLYRCIYCTF